MYVRYDTRQVFGRELGIVTTSWYNKRHDARTVAVEAPALGV